MGMSWTVQRLYLGITEAQLEAGGATLAKETSQAFRIGTGKLRARLLELSLSREDGAALAKLVDRREQAAETVASVVTKIERTIIHPKCEACGHVPDAVGTGGQSRPLHSVRGTETPTNGAAE